jgi:hypothetical protein
MSQGPARWVEATDFFVEGKGLNRCQLTCLQQFSRLNKAFSDLDEGIAWCLDTV